MRKYDFSEDVEDVSLVDIWGTSIQEEGTADAKVSGQNMEQEGHQRGAAEGKCGLGRINRGDRVGVEVREVTEVKPHKGLVDHGEDFGHLLSKQTKSHWRVLIRMVAWYEFMFEEIILTAEIRTGWEGEGGKVDRQTGNAQQERDSD